MERFTGVITKEKNWYVAHCIELGVVSQGKTIEEAKTNLQEVVEGYLEAFGVENISEAKGETLFYPIEMKTSIFLE